MSIFSMENFIKALGIDPVEMKSAIGGFAEGVKRMNAKLDNIEAGVTENFDTMNEVRDMVKQLLDRSQDHEQRLELIEAHLLAEGEPGEIEVFNGVGDIIGTRGPTFAERKLESDFGSSSGDSIAA